MASAKRLAISARPTTAHSTGQSPVRSFKFQASSFKLRDAPFARNLKPETWNLKLSRPDIEHVLFVRPPANGYIRLPLWKRRRGRVFVDEDDFVAGHSAAKLHRLAATALIANDV